MPIRGVYMYVGERLDMAQQTEADDVSTELKEAVAAADGTRTTLNSAPTAKQAQDGRWFVEFHTSHSYGRSNALAKMQDVLPAMEIAYTPQGATQWAAERVPEAERPAEDEAAEMVQEGLEYVSPRGYHAKITEVKATGSIRVEYPNSRFGDSRTEPREGRLAELLASGVCSVLRDPSEGEDEGEQEQAQQEAEQQAEWGHSPRNSREGWDVPEDVAEDAVAVELLLTGGTVYEAWALPQGEDSMCQYADLYVPGISRWDKARDLDGEVTVRLEVAEFEDGHLKVQEYSHSDSRYVVHTPDLTNLADVRPAQEGGN